jgi:hypothetical protein
VVNGEMSLRSLKLSIYEVVMPREEEEMVFLACNTDRDLSTISSSAGDVRLGC